MITLNGKSICENCFAQIDAEPCQCCGFSNTGFSAVPSVLPRGFKLHSRYIIGSIISSGGFGITYLAYDTKEEKPVALKEYFPGGFAGRTENYTVMPISRVTSSGIKPGEVFAKGLERFISEAEYVAQFNGNSNIVSVFECFCENNTAYYTMEYLSGITLEDYVKEYGVLNNEQAAYIADKIAMALIVVHSAELLHRDISPDNIMLCGNGRVKLIDFGAARQYLAEQSQKFTVMMKTGFTPVEQYSKSGNCGAWTDVYSLGTVLYFALMGNIPPSPYNRMVNDNELESHFASDNSPIWRIIDKAVSIIASDHYESAVELKNALSGLKKTPVIVPDDCRKNLTVIEQTFNKPIKASAKVHHSSYSVKSRAKSVGFASVGAAVTAVIFLIVGAVQQNGEQSLSKPSSISTVSALETRLSVTEPQPTNTDETSAPPRTEMTISVDSAETFLLENAYCGNMRFCGEIPFEKLNSFGSAVKINISFQKRSDLSETDDCCFGFLAVDSSGRSLSDYITFESTTWADENGYIVTPKYSLSTEFILSREGIERLDGNSLGFECSNMFPYEATLSAGEPAQPLKISPLSVEELLCTSTDIDGRTVFDYKIDEVYTGYLCSYSRVVPKTAFKEFGTDVKVTLDIEHLGEIINDGEIEMLLPISCGVLPTIFGQNIFVLSDDGKPIKPDENGDCWIKPSNKVSKVSFVVPQNYIDRLCGGINFLLSNLNITNVRLESYEDVTQ